MTAFPMTACPMTASSSTASPERPLGPGDQVFLVDGSSFVFRAYFQSMNQDRKYNTRADGLPTGAVRLFSTKLMQFIRDGATGLKPTHLAIVFDKTEQSFRKEIYADYKAHRPEPPSDLVPQFRLMREAVRAFGLIPIEQDTWEADDIIATYACQASAAGAEVLIVSSDKDLMQAVRPGVTFYDFESGIPGKPGYRPERRLDREGVIEKFGVPPELVPDVQALIGDPTDNVPGVPGIGIKTAAQLISEYGTLEELLDRVQEIKQPKRREALVENADKARISKRLVTLECGLDVGVRLADTRLAEFDARRLLAFTRALSFTTLTKRVADLYGVDPAQVEPDPDLARPWDAAANAWADGASDLFGEAPADDAAATPASSPYRDRIAAGGKAAPPPHDGEMIPAALVAAREAEARAQPCDRAGYRTLASLDDLETWIAAAREHGQVAVSLETSSPDPMVAGIVGIALALEPGMAAYLPLAHRAGDPGAQGGGRDAVRERPRARPGPGRGGARPPQAALRGPGRPQDRPERQARLAGARPTRHRARAPRRHDAPLLRARRRPPQPVRPWPRVARPHLPRPFLPGAGGGGRQGPQGDRLRRGRA